MSGKMQIYQLNERNFMSSTYVILVNSIDKYREKNVVFFRDEKYTDNKWRRYNYEKN